MKPLLLVLTLLHGADATTTVIAGREANPLLPDNPVIAVSIIAPLSVFQLRTLTRKRIVYEWVQETQSYRERDLYVRRNRMWAVISIAVEGVVVAHNVRLLEKRP